MKNKSIETESTQPISQSTQTEQNCKAEFIKDIVNNMINYVCNILFRLQYHFEKDLPLLIGWDSLTLHITPPLSLYFCYI